MTAHVTNGDWQAVSVIGALFLAIAIYVLVDELLAPRRRAAANRRAMAYADNAANVAVLSGIVREDFYPPLVIDHIRCLNDDCDLVLCYCYTDAPCEGTVEPGCSHPAAFVCDEHRLSSCLDCRIDARDDAGMLG